MRRRFRKLSRGEHRYIDISGRYRIVKPKNLAKWKEKRVYNRKKRAWEYKKPYAKRLKRRYKKVIEPKIAVPKAEKPKFMWRLTVALNYVVHNNYYSYKITGYFRTKEEAERKIGEFREKVIEAVKKITGYPRETWWFPDEPNVELETIPYNERYLGTIEEKDEVVLVKNLRSQRRLIEKKRRMHIPLSKF